MSTRAWPIPPGDSTLHLIGDTHFGAIGDTRKAKLLADLGNVLVGRVTAHLQVGDVTNNGLASEDTEALAWLNQLPGPWHVAMGAHDIEGNIRTPAEWAAAYGLASQNHVVDLGFARLIVIGADSANNVMGAATLTWLDEQLDASTDPALIACHYPLYDTVGGDISDSYLSTENAYYAKPDAELRTILADYPQAKAWLAGHTHSRLSNPGFVKAETVGGHVIASVNASSPWYQGRDTSLKHTPLQSVFVTYLGDRIEVRFRDHGGGTWVGRGDGVRIATVML